MPYELAILLSVLSYGEHYTESPTILKHPKAKLHAFPFSAKDELGIKPMLHMLPVTHEIGVDVYPNGFKTGSTTSASLKMQNVPLASRFKPTGHIIVH